MAKLAEGEGSINKAGLLRQILNFSVDGDIADGSSEWEALVKTYNARREIGNVLDEDVLIA